jgi:transcriptional regulator with XRE-family HTH domain
MSKPTEQLRQSRKAAGLSLEDVQKHTKIQTKYLEAVEEGDFSLLPGKFYARAFIRSYAEFLQVDPAPILAYFESAVASEQPADETEDSQSKETPVPSLSRRERFARQRQPKRNFLPPISPKSIGPKWYAGLLLVLFVLLIPIVIYAFGAFDEPQPKDPTAEKKKDGVQAQGVGDGQSGKMADVQLVKPSETHKFGDVFHISKAGKVEVTLKAKEATWFRYRAGGPTEEVTAEGELQPGETKTFKHPNWVSLRVENPSAVELKANGNVIDTTGESSPHTYQFQLKN